MTDTLRFGVIGCGGISAAHLKAIAQIEGAEAVAAADVSEAALRERAETYGIPRRYTKWEDLVADESVDAVSICLPHRLHHPVAVAAAKNGKHALTEKPMCLSLAQCDEMIRAAEEKGVVLMVAQVLRRYPSHKLAKEWIEQGKIGRVTSVVRRRMSYAVGNLETYSWADRPEAAGGWLLYGFGSHEYDALLWLLGARAETVCAVGARTLPAWNDYDEISAVMRLTGGAAATMIQSLNSRDGAWDCAVVGTEGSLTVRAREVSLNGEVTPAPIPDGGPFREQLQEFVDCVRTGQEPGPSGRNVRATIAVLEAVKLSLAQNRTVRVEELSCGPTASNWRAAR